jgi:uncharacterized protein YbjT (DUF2867 family)
MIFVTGATGTVGSQTIKALVAKGASVRAGSRQPEQAKAQLGVEAVAWDWDKPQGFAEALKGVEALLLITPPGTNKELAYGLAAVEAAKAAGVKKIVKLSAIGIENNPASPHRQIELAIEQGPFKWVFLRPSFFMQNLEEGMLDGVKAGIIGLPTGSGRTGFIDARDIGAVAAEALTRGDFDGQGLTLTGPEALTWGEVGQALTRALGRPVRHDDISAETFTARMLAAGMPGHYAEFMTTLYGFVKAGYTATVTPTVRLVLGRDPHSLDQYAQDHKAALNA